MPTEDINTILELKPESTAIYIEKVDKICFFAKLSFYLSLLLVPVSTGSSLIFEYVIYNPPLTALNGLLAWSILLITPLSVLSAVVAIIRIPLRKGNPKGYLFAIIGIILSHS